MGKPMLITFDGYKGAGKTTQARMLAKKLVYPPKFLTEMPLGEAQIKELIETVDEVVKDKTMLLVQKLWSVYQRFRDIDPDRVNITGWYLGWLVCFEPNSVLLRRYLDLLDCNPVISFWLNVPSVVREQRLIKDQRENDGAEAAWTQGPSFQAANLRTIQWLSSELPFFHVLDGILPQEVIAEQIVQILRKEGFSEMLR